MSIACRVREICQHKFTHPNQIHEIRLTSGAHSSKSDGVVTPRCSYCLKYRDGAFIWCRSGLHSTLLLALQVLESNHLEKLQARPEFTAFSHKGRSTASLGSCADSLPPEVYTSPRVSSSHEQFLVQSVPNSAS